MNKTALVAISHPELGPSVANELRRKLSNSALIVESVQSLQQAKSRIEELHGELNLLVTHLDLSESDNTPVARGLNKGFQLLQWAEVKFEKIKGILILPVADPTVSEMASTLRSTAVLAEGLPFYADLVRVASDQLRNEPSFREGYLRITISLDANSRAWTWNMKGEGFAYTNDGVLKIDEEKLQTFILFSRGMAQLDSWRESLLSLGQDLMKHVFLDNSRLWAAFQRGLLYVKDDLSRIRICFSITGDFHPIALEAIASNEWPKEFMMLNAPIYRRVGGYDCSRAPLFTATSARTESEVNCLIIESPTFGRVANLAGKDQKPLNLAPLTRIHHECEKLEEFLQQRKSKFGLGKILCVTEKLAGKEPFKDFLFNILDSDRWDLVHYAGHSFFSQEQKKGFVFFPPQTKGDLVEKVEVTDLGKRLSSTRFVFLSSCQGAETQFLVSLAQCRVPAALGFRWWVDDSMAVEYALEFYRQLFSEQPRRSLEDAFLEARKKMEAAQPANCIWANPILMIQSN
jgi:hypothetical protein